MPIAEKHSTLGLTLWVITGLVVLAIIVAGVLGRLFLKRGLREPFIVRLINRASESVVDAVKRPITIAVLDEVATVLRTGNYTRNLSSALEENREEIKVMVREKIKQDPTASRINLLPFHDRIIEGVSEITLRVILEILADPRTDELVSDILIRLAVANGFTQVARPAEPAPDTAHTSAESDLSWLGRVALLPLGGQQPVGRSRVHGVAEPAGDVVWWVGRDGEGAARSRVAI